MDEASGTGILRHEPRHDGFGAAAGQRPEVAEAIDRHLAEHFGPVDFVLHEFASHLVGVHVLVVGRKPTWAHPPTPPYNASPRPADGVINRPHIG